MIGDSNDSAGTVGFLVGMVVLVFAGIVFSLMVDKRFRFSSGKAELEQEVQDQRRTVEKLEFRLEAAREQWKKEVQPFEGQDQALRAVAADLREGSRRLDALRERRTTVEGEVAAAQEAFRDYRSQYRTLVRGAAAGESLGELRLPSGRTYQGVTISRVNADGMEIRHAEGISRLRPEDLGESWKERFQWHPEEFDKPAPPAVGPKPVAAADEPPAPEPADPVKVAEQAEARKLAALRRDLGEARRFLDKAEAELSRAREASSNSRGASVPGSLETWAEKIRRLESMVSKFRSQYESARANLAAAAPGDPLLQQPADR